MAQGPGSSVLRRQWLEATASALSGCRLWLGGSLTAIDWLRWVGWVLLNGLFVADRGTVVGSGVRSRLGAWTGSRLFVCVRVCVPHAPMVCPPGLR